jgi:carbohydrate ABC transporter substrate-binding protein, CUT1 family (TC 3.A.1.1.-)
MNKKKFVFIAGCIGFILCLLQAVFILRKDRQITIELGIFAGSNWDVANANSYVIIDKAIERFEQEHKNVKIHYTSGILKRDYSEWLAQQLLMGKMPDVFMILSDDFNRLASLGALKNLEKLMNKDTAFKLEKYFSTTLLTGQYNGIQFALPYETVPTLMFVNKTLLKKEGIEVPDSDWTWDDLLEISKKVTKDTDGDGYPDQFGTYNYDWLDAAYTNGVVLFENGDTKISLTNEKVVEAVKFVKQLYDLNQGRKVTQDDFDSGKVAFMPLTFADYRTYKTYPYKIKKYLNFRWDCITLPAGPAGDNISEVNTLLMGISNKTKHEKLAWEFLKLLTYDDEIQMDIFRYSQGASVLKNVTGSEEAAIILQEYMEESEKVIDNNLLSEVLEQGMVAPQFLKYKEAVSLATSEIRLIIENDKNIDSSLKILQNKINQYLKQ